MFARGDCVVGVSNTRGVVESLAAIWSLKTLIEAEIGRGTASDDVCDRLRQFYLGSRVNADLPNALNVLTMLKRADAELPGILAKYDRMSEFAHPNYDGAGGSFGKPDQKTLITHFGRGLRDSTYPTSLGLRCLIASIDALTHAYNKIGDLLEPFSLACERSLSSPQ